MTDWQSKYYGLLELLEGLSRLIRLRDSFAIGPVEYKLKFQDLRDKIDEEVLCGLDSKNSGIKSN